MKIYLTLVMACIGLHSAITFGKAPEPISQQASEVQACYTQYPFLLSAIHEVSDRDFLDKEKSMNRLSHIRNSVNKSSKKILKCVDQILSFAETDKSLENITFVSLRMSEVRVLLLLEKISERNLAKK